MSTQVQLRRGTSEQNNQFVGAIGEVTYCTDTKELRVHDGQTIGGGMLPSIIRFKTPSQDDFSWYIVWSNGWCEQGGRITSGQIDTNITVPLPLTMANDYYYCNLTSNSQTNTFNAAQPNWVVSRTVNNFNAHIDAFVPNSTDWEVKGMANLEELI